jgi:polyferredoxin
MYKRPRVIIYSLILLTALSGIVYGFTTLAPTEFKVIHDRQPLFVRLSDGSIQNKYTLKLLNKTQQPIEVEYQLSGLDGASLHGINESITVAPGKVIPVTALVRVPGKVLEGAITPIEFEARVLNNPDISASYSSMFMGPK